MTAAPASSSLAYYYGHGASSSLYGVGLSYQLYEMQQIYRHPRKIYEIAVSVGSSQVRGQNKTKQKYLTFI